MISSLYNMNYIRVYYFIKTSSSRYLYYIPTYNFCTFEFRLFILYVA